MQQQSSKEHAQPVHRVHSPRQTQGDTKPLLAARRHRPRAVLPNELLLHIFSYVEGKRDLANLCQCSKVFQDIADGYLYRNLNLDFCSESNGTAAEKLLQSIQNPRYSSIVKELRVKVGGCSPGGWGVPPDGCPCDKRDMLLRKALHYAKTLEVLRIRCFFCPFATPERHRYLTDLPTLTLREFYSDCSCGQVRTTSHFGGSSNTKHMSAPNWMRSVTSLNLESGKQWAFPEELLQRWMQNDELLPNLHTLNYYGPGICSELLAKRVIRRLVALYANPNDALRRHPDKKALTHLVARYEALETFLNSVGNTNQFSNLQHIGFLWSYVTHDITEEFRLEIVNRRLESIVDLKQLVSIQVLGGCSKRFLDEEIDAWHRELFKRLESVHPKLCRFFLMDLHTCVWVRREDSGVWEKRRLPGFSSWDLMTGVYDDL